MARLFPSDFDLGTLPWSERSVIELLLPALDDTWWLIPNVAFHADRDREIDLIILSRTHDVVLVEVKGGIVTRTEGRWQQYDRPMGSPTDQVRDAKHKLVQQLKRRGVDLTDLFMRHVVALPDVAQVPVGGFGIDAPADMIWSAAELREPLRAIRRLSAEHAPIPESRVEAFLSALKPSVAVEFDPRVERRSQVARLDEVTRDRLDVLATLDAPRVLVTGAAGTGKSWLVARWARRAADRGERVAVVCFNRPIADQLRRGVDRADVWVSTYHDLIVRLLQPLGWSVPEDPTSDFWEHEPTAALLDHIDRVEPRFDTIVVDEGQDIRAAWLTSLESLLPASSGRVLMVADPAQTIYGSGWEPPEGYISLPLSVNLRNSRSIARIVQRLGGAEALASNPVGAPVRAMAAGGMKEVRKRVRDEVERLVTEEGLAAEEIAVLTTRSEPRTRLLDQSPDGVQLARWEDQRAGVVLCETVHRTKGLEWPAVIVVDLSDEPDRRLLYIGTSRARTHLSLVGTRGCADACGVEIT